jgi:hypothetical protein
VTFDPSGVGSFTCVTPTPSPTATPTPTPTPTPDDGQAHSCAIATNMGTLAPGTNVSEDGTGPNPGVGNADWFEVTFSADTLTLTGSQSGETGIVFDVYYNCNGGLVSSDADVYVCCQEVVISTPGTYYIEVYPLITDSSSGGTYTLTATVS